MGKYWKKTKFDMGKFIKKRGIDLSIIIVSYNTKKLLEECIRSVQKTTKKIGFEIIVVDNASSDGSYQMLENLQKEKVFNKSLILIKSKENIGFSKGNNLGIKVSSGKYLLFLNPDTVVYEKTKDGMFEFMEQHPECGASTCFVELLSGKLDDSSHRGFPTPSRSFFHFSGISKVFKNIKLFNGYNLSYLDISKTHEIDSLAGSFMLVPFNVGDKLGWWDEDYFFYGEDIDFCYRIKKAGYKIYFVPEFKTLHLKGISSGIKSVSKDITKATNETKRRATHHRFNSMEIFYNKHYKKIYPKIVTYLVLVGIKIKRKIAERKI